MELNFNNHIIKLIQEYEQLHDLSIKNHLHKVTNEYYSKCASTLELKKEFVNSINSYLEDEYFIVLLYPSFLGLKHFDEVVFKNTSIATKIEQLSEMHMKVKEGQSLYVLHVLNIKQDPNKSLPSTIYIWAKEPEQIFEDHFVKRIISYKDKLKSVNQIITK